MLLFNNLLLNLPTVTLTIANVINNTTVGAVVLDASIHLTAANISTTQTTNNVGLIQQNNLTIANILNNQTLISPQLTQANSLNINNILTSNLINNISLTQTNNLVIANIANVTTLSSFALTQQAILTINNLLNTLTTTNINLIQSNILTLANLLINTTLSNTFATTNLPVSNLLQSTSLNSINLVQNNILIISNLLTSNTLDNIVVINPLFSTVNQLVLRSELPAYIELFTIDCTSIPEINTVYYITPHINSDGISKVFFGGQLYTPFPVQLTGFGQTADGAYPRPRLDIANINKIFGTLAFIYGDLVGCSVTYTRTFKVYLNSNFKLSAPPLKYYIAKKLNHDTMGMSFELRNALDKERAYLPSRQMLKRDFPGLGINKAIR